MKLFRKRVVPITIGSMILCICSTVVDAHKIVQAPARYQVMTTNKVMNIEEIALPERRIFGKQQIENAVDQEIMRAQAKREQAERIRKEKEIEQRQKRIEQQRGYREVVVRTTAYTMGDGYTPSSKMANGEHCSVGSVAYNGVPLGTKIEIDGVMYTVKDRCGYDNTIDIYMADRNKAINYGVQNKKVKIYHN